MKLKDLSSLGAIYEDINKNSPKTNTQPTPNQDVLLTDASIYLPENKMVKAGSPLGGGPGVKGEEVPLIKKSGPEGLKGNNFEKVDKIQDPGSDATKMKEESEEEGEDTKDTTAKDAKAKDTEENTQADDTAKITTPKEKVRESAGESNKYNYKPKFTMSKLKFDQLYEEAIKRVPFTEDADTEMAGEAELPDTGAEDIAPADDTAADADTGSDAGAEEGGDVTITLDRETAQKLCDLINAQLNAGAAGAEDMGGSEDMGGTEGGDETIAEEVEAEDEGHPLHNLKKGKPDNPKGSNQVGDLKKAGGTADKGSLKSEPEPKELGDKSGPLKGKNNKAGSGTVVTPGKKAFE